MQHSHLTHPAGNGPVPAAPGLGWEQTTLQQWLWWGGSGFKLPIVWQCYNEGVCTHGSLELLGKAAEGNVVPTATLRSYLICPDKRLHCQMVFHQFVYVGLCLNQELCLGQRGKAGAQRGGALVSSAWSSSGVGVAKEDVP